MKGFFEDLEADLKAVGRARDDIRVSNFQAWHIRADAEASMREARRELITRGWLFPHHLPFLDADEIKFVGEHFMDFLNAFINRTHVIENVPDELINKMISNFAVAGGLDQIDHAIEVYKGFADSGLDEICIRVHGDQAEQIKLIGEHIMPAFR
jgi:hypothetical protein